MSQGYTVLARRYRSQNFDELIGQEVIAQTLKNAVTSGRLAHAFLFTGTRGVGKTSAARILAKAINCPKSKNGQPCGACPTCKAIAAGEEIDVIEIDGASNNGVEQIRDLRQNAGITPSHSPFKIYIIDEVHMLSMAAFNALLKTLEEPPPHVKFIFATTDVHKVPPTILSRCQRYDFKNIPTTRIAEHLAAVCKQEKAEAEPAALHRIALLASGSMRDALSLLDRVLSLGAGRITETLLDELLGKPSVVKLASLMQAMADGDAAGALTQSDKMLAEGMSPEQALGELTEMFRNVMILRLCGENTTLLEIPAEWRGPLASLAPRFEPAILVHHIAMCDQVLRSLRGAGSPRPLFDALIVRLALSREFSSIRELLEQAPASGAALPEKKNEPLNAGNAGSAPPARPVFTPQPRFVPSAQQRQEPTSPAPPAVRPMSPALMEEARKRPAVRKVMEKFGAAVVNVQQAAEPLAEGSTENKNDV
jgi:DNA polymerase III subunit gamma/tau